MTFFDNFLPAPLTAGKRCPLEPSASIDNITMTARWQPGLKQREVQRWLDECLYIKSLTMAKVPYRWNILFLDGSIIQLADKNIEKSWKVSPIRLEFNPNKCNIPVIADFINSFMTGIKITRIDIALDYIGLDITEGWKPIYRRLAKENIHLGYGGALETHYIGAAGSEKRFRIYDKRTEMLERQEVDTGHEWTRVEVQNRGDLSGNPFTGLYLVRMGGWENLNWEERAKLEYLSKSPERMGEIGKKARIKYRDMFIREVKEKISIADDYKKHEESLLQSLNWWKAPKIEDTIISPFDGNIYAIEDEDFLVERRKISSNQLVEKAIQECFVFEE